jgi:hypothetical protein
MAPPTVSKMRLTFATSFEDEAQPPAAIRYPSHAYSCRIVARVESGRKRNRDML